jgi:hypothetical protein
MSSPRPCNALAVALVFCAACLLTGLPGLDALCRGLLNVDDLFVGSLLAGEMRLRDVIDERLQSAWRRQAITPAEVSDDGEFLRRSHLDLLGTIPTAEEAAQFLDDPDPQKRQRWIDRLLEDPRYAVHQADIWDLVLFGRDPPGYYARERLGFQDWLRRQFAANTPYDQMVLQMLKAEGDTVEQGAPMFLVQYDRQPEDAAVAVTRIFLGVQLECARCHDHPFEDYSQRDFYGMAAFFARLQLVELGSKDKQKQLALGEMNRGEILFSGKASEQTPGKKGEPVGARFMKGAALEEPALGDDVEDPKRFPNGKLPPKPRFSRKDALADWLASPDNPFFARAVANRVWAQLMGRGIVHPVDHLSETNPPSHPELLELLTAELREIVNSHSYQLSGRGATEEALPLWFERARFRPLSAEELLAAWRVAGGYDATLADSSSGADAEDRFKVQGVTWDYVRRFFGTPNDGVGNFQGGMSEHLYMNNGQVHSLITRKPGGLHDTLIKSSNSWEARVERLFLQTLSRRPTPAENKKFVEYLRPDNDAAADRDLADRLHNAIWSLMTCSEFRFNH